MWLEPPITDPSNQGLLTVMDKKGIMIIGSSYPDNDLMKYFYLIHNYAIKLFFYIIASIINKTDQSSAFSCFTELYTRTAFTTQIEILFIILGNKENCLSIFL